MSSEFKKDNKLNHKKNLNNLIDDIIDIDKFKKLDDRYLITEACDKMNLKYELDEGEVKVYYNSFSLSISLDKQSKIDTMGCFIDPKILKIDHIDKLMNFSKYIFSNIGNVNMSITSFRNILNRIVDGNIKEIKEEMEHFKLFVSKMINNSNDLIFIMINMNN